MTEMPKGEKVAKTAKGDKKRSADRAKLEKRLAKAQGVEQKRIRRVEEARAEVAELTSRIADLAAAEAPAPAPAAASRSRASRSAKSTASGGRTPAKATRTKTTARRAARGSADGGTS